MRRINIYAETKPQSFKRAGRAVGYVLELVDIEGTTVATATNWEWQVSTWNEGILQAFVSALGRLKSPCEVHLYTQNRTILDLFDNNLDKWMQTGYRNSRGQEIRNAQLWRQLAGACRGHLMLTEETHGAVHPFYHWMMDQMDKEFSA